MAMDCREDSAKSHTQRLLANRMHSLSHQPESTSTAGRQPSLEHKNLEYGDTDPQSQKMLIDISDASTRNVVYQFEHVLLKTWFDRLSL